MESITTFASSTAYSGYPNAVDMLAHVPSEEKVYINESKGEYDYVISAWFKIETRSDFKFMAKSAILRVPKIRINNLSNNTVTIQVPTTRLVLNPGVYRIDYGIFKHSDGTYHLPSYIFDTNSDVHWSFDNNKVRYFIAYPQITTIEANSVIADPLLTGGYFKAEEEGLQEMIQEVDNYFLNDVQPTLLDINKGVVEGHITTVDRLFAQCNNVGDVYLDENVSTVTGVFLRCRSNAVPSTIHIGSKVRGIYLPHQWKVRKVEISENNPYIEWDESIRCVVEKELVNGKKQIVTGGGIWENDYLYIPSGYNIRGSYPNYQSYVVFEGRNTKIVNLLDYDGTNVTGFKDSAYIETFILPKTTTQIGLYTNSLQRVKNFVIPTKVAPLVPWYSDSTGRSPWGARGSQYGYSFVEGGNEFGGRLGDKVDVSERKLYVIEGTQSDKDSWTEQYDRTNIAYWKNSDTQTNERDNVWHDVTLDIEDPNVEVQEWKRTKDLYRQYTLNYLSEDEMTNKINSLIPND